MKIRKYEDRDWNRLKLIHDEARKIELEDAGLPDAYLSLEETYESEELFQYDILVYEEDNLVMGFIAYCEGEIAWLYVDPAYHRRGIARKLIEEAIEKLDAVILVEVLENNRAIKVYEKLGFSVIESVSGMMPGNESFKVRVNVLEYRK